MNLKIGIVGLPNAGKSTLFNALLKKQVANVASYPFCTIEPNVGVVPVPDGRLEDLARIVEAESGKKPPIVPAVVEFVDIAGLVKGAAKGEGLGNKFLSHIREVNLICHVLRQFDDSNIMHVAENVDPARDKDIVETELIMADLETLNKQAEPRGIKDKFALKKYTLIKLLKQELNNGKKAIDVINNAEDKELIMDLQLLTMKPVLYVMNVGEDKLSPAKQDLALPDNYPIKSEDMIIISAKIEAELANLTDDEQTVYLKELGFKNSGLDRLIQKAYEMLHLISFLTAGEIEVKAWTIEAGTKAPQAAGVIHTDFVKGFIKAEVISFSELIKCGNFQKAGDLGKLRLEGREYVMKDGDVVEFKVNA